MLLHKWRQRIKEDLDKVQKMNCLENIGSLRFTSMVALNAFDLHICKGRSNYTALPFNNSELEIKTSFYLT